MFLSDAPDLPTGLARISRDLAIRLSGEPAFRVGFLGLHGTGNNKGTEESFSTSPNTKKGEQRVPRNGDGQFDERVDWADGTKTYLSAEINPFRFKLPAVAVTT